MANQNIFVAGAGTMGRGIAQVAAQAGYQVWLYDCEPGQAEKGVNRIQKSFQKMADKGELRKEALADLSGNVAAAENLEKAAGSSFVIEAITEDREEKRKILERIDALCGKDTVMASNTSSIPITTLASFTGHPENVIGMHFMNPVPLMPGVEIIRALKTSDETHRKTIRLAEEFSKIPIHAADKAGFVINRIVMPMINESIAVVEEGTSSIVDVDRGAVHCLNHPLGPLALSDLIGNDTTHHILSVLQHELGERFKPAPLLTRMVEAGWLGNKTGAGFYIWENNKPGEVNKILSRYL